MTTMEPHPLLQTPVLRSLFNCLKDKETILSCRKVHPHWTHCINGPASSILSLLITKPRVRNLADYASVSSNSNVTSLRQLLTDPNARLTCKNLTIGPKVFFNSPPIHSFLEDYGTFIQRLSIKDRVNTLAILVVLNECPNLRHLDINPKDLTLEIPESHLNTWNSPLPALKALTLHPSRNDYMEWERARGDAVTRLEAQFDLVTQLIRKIPSLETFTVDKYILKMWEKIATRFGQQPEIVTQLKNVDLHIDDVSNLRLNNIWPPQLNVTLIEIGDLSHSIREFSNLLAYVSRTLKELKVQTSATGGSRLKVSTCGGLPARRNVDLVFRNEMEALKQIVIVPTVFHMIYCSAPENVNLLQQLSHLSSFQIVEKHQFEPQLQGWRRIFPVAQQGNFIHDFITEFCIGWVVPSQAILLEIRRCFPQLKKLGLGVKGELLQRLAVEFANSEIRDLEINYFEGRDGIEEFASGISGLSTLSCEQFGSAKFKESRNKKIRSSFADWRGLRTLCICYEDGDSEQLTNVCVERGFALMTQLERLTLKNFEIHPQQISTILDEVHLLTFDLRKSDVNTWDWRGPRGALRAANSAAVAGIRTRFPLVSLKL